MKNFEINCSIYLRTYQFGTDLKDQQVGCLWSGKNILSVSLSGQISYLDRDAPKASRVIRVNFHFFQSTIFYESIF
jgi:hypothetical protein